MSDEDVIDLESAASSCGWLSEDDVDGRCAVRSGDLGGISDVVEFPSAQAASSAGFGTTASNGDMTLEPLGVDVAEDGPPSITDAGMSFGDFGNGRAGGRGVVSGAS